MTLISIGLYVNTQIYAYYKLLANMACR